MQDPLPSSACSLTLGAEPQVGLPQGLLPAGAHPRPEGQSKCAWGEEQLMGSPRSPGGGGGDAPLLAARADLTLPALVTGSKLSVPFLEETKMISTET